MEVIRNWNENENKNIKKKQNECVFMKWIPEYLICMNILAFEIRWEKKRNLHSKW